jgi:diguanylate cyclase (GGDEF)-like protein
VFVEQVRRDQGRALEPHSLATAMDDPELAVRAEAGTAVLGQRSVRLTDGLTGLYSHRYLRELVASETERAIVQARPYAVVMARLTGLAQINREEGYARGDAVIRAAALAAQAAADRCDGTACRDSGDRLAVIAPGAGEGKAEALADELREGLAGVAEAIVSLAVWRAGDQPEDVVARARAGGDEHISSAPAPTPVARDV